jgi:NAD+ kinase
VPRVINVTTTVNGVALSNYKVDGVIVSTATGSTGYSLAAGGPILYPQAEEILIKPVAAHLSLPYALVLPPGAEVKMVVHTNHEAVLSIDGQVNVPLQDGDSVIAKRSPYFARFLRESPRDHFYAALEQRLRK